MFSFGRFSCLRFKGLGVNQTNNYYNNLNELSLRIAYANIYGSEMFGNLGVPAVLHYKCYNLIVTGIC